MAEDRELNAVLIALAPLGPRGMRYVDVPGRRFEFDRAIEEVPWSSGERAMLFVARSLWNDGTVDLGYVVCGLSDDFFQAVLDAIAARRGRDVRTAYAEALAEVSDD